MKKTLGRMVLALGIIMNTIGLTFQIYKNYIEKTCGISIVVLSIALALFAFRIPYSMAKKAWYLVPVDLCATIVCTILVAQWFIYR